MLPPAPVQQQQSSWSLLATPHTKYALLFTQLQAQCKSCTVSADLEPVEPAGPYHRSVEIPAV